MDKALLAQALMYCGFDTTMAMRYAEDMVAYAQRHCDHPTDREAVSVDSTYHLGLPKSGIPFCGRCGKTMEEHDG